MDLFPPAHVAPRKDNTGLIVGLVLGGFLLMCIAPAVLIVVCLAAIQILGQNANSAFGIVGASIGATVGGKVTLDADDAKFLVEDFLDDLTLKDFNRAHSMFSRKLRQSMPKQQLEALVKRHPGLAQRETRDSVNEVPNAVGANRRRYAALLPSSAHQAIMDVILEDGEAKIDSLEVRDVPPR